MPEATLRAGQGLREEGVFQREIVNGDGRYVIADSLDVSTGEMINPRIVQEANGKSPRIHHRLPRPLDRQRLGALQRAASSPWELPLRAPPRPSPSLTSTTTPQELARKAADPTKMSYRQLKQRIRQAERQKLSTLKWDIAVQNKFSIPFSCLVFALLAPALGIRSHRGSGSIGMGIAILIGFAYYVVWNYLANLAEQGGISPFWAAWLPNFLTAGVGLTLIFRARR